MEVGPAGRLGLSFSRHLPLLFIPLQKGDKTGRSVTRRLRTESRRSAGHATHRGRGRPQQGIGKQEEIVAFDVLCQERRGVVKRGSCLVTSEEMLLGSEATVG